MADLIDVLNAVETVVLSVLYPPDGSIAGGGTSPVAGCLVATIKGRPGANALDEVAASAEQNPQRVLVEIANRPGMQRNTTRFPQRWQVQSRGSTSLAIAIDASGTVATLSGTLGEGPAQNVALIVGFGATRPKAYAYTVLPSDTLTSIATALAALVDADTPASASGPAVTIAAAHSLVGRVGGISTVQKPLMQQIERIAVDIWAPAGAPLQRQVRDLVAAPIKTAIAGMRFLTLADGTGARIVTRGDFLLDDPEKAGLYRRCLAYDIEYSTTIEGSAAIVIAAGGALQGGAAATGSFTEASPPVVTAEA